MQIWIYFEPGAGGDGIANLLEHSNNVSTVVSNSGEVTYKVIGKIPDRRDV